MQYVTYSTATAICLSQYTIGSVTAKYTAQNDMTILFVRLVYPDSTVNHFCKTRILTQGTGDLIILSSIGGPIPIFTSVIVLPSSIHSLYSLFGSLLAYAHITFTLRWN